jgi:hypothetical protein
MNNGPQQETVKKPKRRWGTLAELSIFLWVIAWGLPAVFSDKASRIEPPLVAVIISFALLILSATTAVLALKRRQKGEIEQLFFGVIGLVGSAMILVWLVTVMLLRT